MLDALQRPLTSPWALLLLVGACSLLGALHAMTPGHGKTLLAAYLVGDRGTARQAVTLGMVITLTHTGAVLVLGGAVLLAGQYVIPSVLVPVLTAAAGVAVLLLGARLIRRRWSGRNGDSGHGTPNHIHETHGHGHGHAAVLARPAGVRGLATMGIAAGIIPCPEAFSVLLLAIGLNRTALGLGMVLAFSIGLAAVLVGLGLLLVTAAPLLSRCTGHRFRWVSARLPLLSAIVVAILGVVMTMSGLSSLTT
jgi:nickel/cobalt transporter (NicO) family protein